MKLRLLLVATVGVLFFSSCEKEAVSEQVTEIEQTDGVLRIIAEDSAPLTWDEMPELIRNAEFSNPGLTTKDLEDESRDGCPKFINMSPAHGDHGGGPFVMMPETSCDRILAVVVKASSSIRKLFLVYLREDGSTYISAEAGNTGGVFFHHILAENVVIDQFATRFTNTVKFMRIRTFNTITHQTVSTFEVGSNSGTFRPYAYGGDQILGFYGEDGDRVNRLGALVYEEDN